VIDIRPIARGEGALLLPMTQVIADTHRQGSVKATPEDYERAFFAEHPIVGALLARVDGEIAGAAVWHRSFSTNAGREIMYLEDLAVLPEYQRRGVAQALMKALAQLALERGYPKIFWLAMQWNAGAVQFYKGLGAAMQPENIFCWLDGPALEALAR
jgi:GNAT superfamily N-acetyltransferase